MFIVLEGLDGAGKSTQAALLRDYFADRNIATRLLHFPRFDTPVFGDLIARFLRGDFGAVDAVDPYLVALLYAGDRRQAADDIRAWRDKGDCVVLDRYVYSNIAYQCAKLPDAAGREALRRWILEMEYRHFSLPQPDLTVFLDVPLTHVEETLREARTGNDRAYLQGKPDIHEASLMLQRNVRQMYREQADADPTFHVIDCADGHRMLAPQPIFEQLKALL
jgi:dTMP kinase